MFWKNCNANICCIVLQSTKLPCFPAPREWVPIPGSKMAEFQMITAQHYALQQNVINISS